MNLEEALNFGMSQEVLNKLRQDNHFQSFTETQKAALEAGLCKGESLSYFLWKNNDSRNCCY
jgi:hypothetical protein